VGQGYLPTLGVARRQELLQITEKQKVKTSKPANKVITDPELW
jgi:hypothetical protein